MQGSLLCIRSVAILTHLAKMIFFRVFCVEFFFNLKSTTDSIVTSELFHIFTLIKRQFQFRLTSKCLNLKNTIEENFCVHKTFNRFHKIEALV